MIAKKLLNERLIACANITEGVESFFWWQGKIDKAQETLLVIKTARKNFGKIQKRIKGLHSYEIPEIIALPIIAGENNYLKWINKSIVNSSE
jgi:periplasmic divalent cation tolerance protein